MSKVLLIIDLQNDYFENGAFPLWDTEAVLDRTLALVGKVGKQGIPAVLIQHIGPEASPFFKPGTHGVQLHDRLRAALPDAPVVTKAYADSFHQTNLEEVLSDLGATELLVCGMMTQNCVTHTAISKSAEKYDVSIVGDCCTTVSEILHVIALKAIETRTTVLTSAKV